MKNLKIYNETFKRLMSAGLAVVLAGSLTGCRLDNNPEETISDEKKLETVIAGNKVISVADLRLKDTETNKVLENEEIEAILVGDKLDREFDLIEIIFNASVESILINDELVSVDRLVLVNSKTNQDIDKLDYALVGDELIPMDKYYLGNSSETKEDKKEECVKETVCEEEYEELTTEKFEKLVASVYKKYEEIGLDVTKEEVIDFVMMVNIEKISKDNKELITSVVGDRNSDTVTLNMNDVYSAIKTKNNFNYCDKGLGWDSLILVSDTVFDKATKEKVVEFENRVKEIFEAAEDKEEFDKLLNKLLNEILISTEEEFNMEYGAGYSLMNSLMYFIRINFITPLGLDEIDLEELTSIQRDQLMSAKNVSSLEIENARLIRYMCNTSSDLGTKYYKESRATAYYNGMYYLLTDNVNCYIRTK